MIAMSLRKRRIITLIVFVVLQAIKPLIVVFVYKEITNFHPTIVNNYEIYQMVLEHVFRGSMKMTYTIAFIISEIFFLSIPVVLYRKLNYKKS